MTSAITVEGLTKSFGPLLAVDHVGFEVPAGSVFGLLGPNGAGKTTTIRILSTILVPDSGRADVLGHDVVREAGRVRSIIGLAGQYAAVDPNLTGAENLRLIGRLVHMDRRQVGPRAVELLERFALEHAGNRPVRTYSGGMRRRLDLAAALVHRPPVLFLDEPTTGLDIQGRQELWSVIQQLVNDGTTVLLTTQYLEEADRLAQRIAVIDGGRVIANDTPSVLKARLGATVIELGFAAEPEARRAHERVGGLGLHAERTGTTLRVTSNEGPRLLVDVLRSLDDQLDGQLEPAHVAVREPTLDDVFLSLTGHHAEPQQPEEPEREQEQQPDRETEQEWAS